MLSFILTFIICFSLIYTCFNLLIDTQKLINVKNKKELIDGSLMLHECTSARY